MERSLEKWFRYAGRALISGWAAMWLVLVVAMHVDEPEPLTEEYVSAVAFVVGVPALLAILSWASERAATGFLLFVGFVAPLVIPPARFGGYNWETVAWSTAVVTVPCWVTAGALIGARFVNRSWGGKDG